MKHLIAVILYLSQFGFVAAQSNLEKIPSFYKKSYGTIENISEDVILFKNNRTGKVKIKNLTDVDIENHKGINKNSSINKLVIDINTFRFEDYSYLYHQWSQAPLTNWKVLKAVDANDNGRAELYGIYDIWPEQDYATNRIYELGENGIFNYVYEFEEDTINFSYDIGDLDGDGLLDLVTQHREHAIYIYSQSNVTDHITTRKFIYGFWERTMQPNNIAFYDFDGDEVLEIVYNLDAGGNGEPWSYSNHIAKYNPVIDNYEMVYFHKPARWSWGLSVGDYDDDGLGNMAAGDSYGTVYLYEYDGTGGYNLQIIDTLDVNNAFLTTYSPDLDGNGKSELWIGGDSYGSITGGYTRIYMFEAEEDNKYEAQFCIDILGLFSWSAGNMWTDDLDNDGTDELLLSVDAGVFAFKCVGESDYELLLAIPNPTVTDGNLWPDGANSYDLDSDGKSEIYISGAVHADHYVRSRTIIYKTDIVSSVDEEPVEQQFNLFQNYPNPFNPITEVRYTLQDRSFVNIKVYNLLGEEVMTLISEEQPGGEYKVDFNAKDLSSGIYIINMNAGSYSKSIKAILLK